MRQSNEARQIGRSRLTGLPLRSWIGTALLAFAAFTQQAMAQTQHFPEARESNDKLLALYSSAADLCVRNPNRDVEVAVACQSMAIYGMALNERGMCLGKQDEPNAMQEWHPCAGNSLRFPTIRLPEGFQ
ncbi:hypothetical protein ACWGNA_12250 [Brucella cytisi]|uniref:hypothetical protein n=1 Tax=Brucella cytisi TaxID=407152 RepID=UPI0035DA3759